MPFSKKTFDAALRGMSLALSLSVRDGRPTAVGVAKLAGRESKMAPAEKALMRPPRATPPERTIRCKAYVDRARGAMTLTWDCPSSRRGNFVTFAVPQELVTDEQFLALAARPLEWWCKSKRRALFSEAAYLHLANVVPDSVAEPRANSAKRHRVEAGASCARQPPAPVAAPKHRPAAPSPPSEASGTTGAPPPSRHSQKEAARPAPPGASAPQGGQAKDPAHDGPPGALPSLPSAPAFGKRAAAHPPASIRAAEAARDKALVPASRALPPSRERAPPRASPPSPEASPLPISRALEAREPRPASPAVGASPPRVVAAAELDGERAGQETGRRAESSYLVTLADAPQLGGLVECYSSLIRRVLASVDGSHGDEGAPSPAGCSLGKRSCALDDSFCDALYRDAFQIGSVFCSHCLSEAEPLIRLSDGFFGRGVARSASMYLKPIALMEFLTAARSDHQWVRIAAYLADDAGYEAIASSPVADLGGAARKASASDGRVLCFTDRIVRAAAAESCVLGLLSTRASLSYHRKEDPLSEDLDFSPEAFLEAGSLVDARGERHREEQVANYSRSYLIVSHADRLGAVARDCVRVNDWGHFLPVGRVFVKPRR